MDRMPPLQPAAMSEDQLKAAESFREKRGVAIDGPFIPLLRSPGLLDPLHQVGLHCRYRNALGLRLSEFIILNVARRHDQKVEWAIHAPIAAKAGVGADTIQALLEGRRPTAMNNDEALVYDAVQELWASNGWSDVTYSAVLNRFGEAGLIDLVGTVGYYTTLAMVMNVARTEHPGASPLPPRG